MPVPGSATLLLALAVISAPCRGQEPGGSGGKRATAEAWVTTADKSRLMARAPNVSWAGGKPNGVTAIIDVDTAITYQEMVGFGAAITDASAWLIQTKLSPTKRQALLQDLFGRSNGIGLSFTRLTIGASDFSRTHYTFDDVRAGESDSTLAHFSIDANRPDVLPVVKRALAINRDLRVMASPWSAPAWMKTTRSLIKGTLRVEAYPAFAEYLRRYVEAYQAEGVPIFAITLQNEPHFEPENYPGMRLTPSQRATLIGSHVGPLFDRAGIATRILDWDHNWDEPDSPLAVLEDSTARRYVTGVAWHCYKGDVAAQTPVHDAYPEKEVYFTECSGGQWAPSWGDNLTWYVRTLIIGSTRGWAKGVLLWNLALDESHGPHLGGCGDCRGVVTIDARTGAVTRNEEYYALAHASRFVRPGAKRIASTTGVDSLETVAFRNANGESTVLIVVNTGKLGRTFAVRSAGRSFRFELPPAAVVTFRWQ